MRYSKRVKVSPIFFGHLIKERLLSGVRGRILQWLIRPALRRIHHEINPERYNGACFAGLNKVVVKSHGGANRVAMTFAIREAIEQIRLDVPSKIWQALDNLEHS